VPIHLGLSNYYLHGGNEFKKKIVIYAFIKKREAIFHIFVIF